MTNVLDRPPTPVAIPAAHSPRRSNCFYTPSADPSGMGAHLLDLVAAYAPAADVAVMCRPTDGGRRVLQRAAALGARTVALPGPRDPSFAVAIHDFLRQHPADVFHCHVGLGWEDWDGVRAARRAGVGTVVQTQHLPFLLSRSRKREGMLRALRHVDRVIAVSEGMRATYERIGVPDGRLTTIPNGVRPRGAGPGRASARKALGLAADQPVVLTIGRLTHMKGQRHLVQAVPALLERFPRLAVVVIGAGPLRGHLTAQAGALGAAHAVHLAGYRADARMLLDAADVFVLPSRHEGMPLAALEAMDAGLPVVATRVLGTAEVVVDGSTGLLVHPEDPPALAAALARLLGDATLRDAYGRAGRRRYLQLFTAARMAKETLALYEQALSAQLPCLAGDQALELR